MVRPLGGLYLAMCSVTALVLSLGWEAYPENAQAPTYAPVTAIKALLDAQSAAWNRGDIDGFMAGYWKSDETAFVGASGMTRGWQSVLEHYQKIYPNRQAMGQLTFSALEIHLVCPDAAFAIGQFQLERETDKPAGIFTLNFRKFPEGWRIVADHTTAFASPEPVTASFEVILSLADEPVSLTRLSVTAGAVVLSV